MSRSVSITLLFFLVLYGCAGITSKETPERTLLKETPFSVTDISKGLPVKGLWRQNVALIDANGDGFLDIVAPPPRKADVEKRRPFIFIWNQKDGKWEEAKYNFPDLRDYDYGGVAVGDVNNDGYFDIVFASHGKRIILLLNDKSGGFIEAAFPNKKGFHSRTVALSDVNGDGWLDIISFSEFSKPEEKLIFREGEKKPEIDREPKDILLGINRSGKDWDARIIGNSFLFGDSLAIGDITGDGSKDILIAPLVMQEGFRNRVLLIGDGKGNFKEHRVDNLADYMMYFVRTGDIDGDGIDEVVFILSGMDTDSKVVLKAFKWGGANLDDISTGLEIITAPRVFDLADIDGDGKQEIVVLSSEGLSILTYHTNKWNKVLDYPIPDIDIRAVYGLQTGKQMDGSWLIVYNLGSTQIDSKGIRAYLLK